MQITAVLSWINLVIASILVLSGLIMTQVYSQLLTILTSVVLAGAIILHSYAALQLRKSILHPEIPLSRNTPTGIRFMGLMAFFYAILNAVSGASIIQHSGEYVKQMKIPPGAEHLPLGEIVQVAGVLSLLFSLTIGLNVLLNLRALRWWYISQRPS